MSKHPNQHLFTRPVTPAQVKVRTPGHRCSVADQLRHQFTYGQYGMVYIRPASKAWLQCQEARSNQKRDEAPAESPPLDEPVWTADDWNGRAA